MKKNLPRSKKIKKENVTILNKKNTNKKILRSHHKNSNRMEKILNKLLINL